MRQFVQRHATKAPASSDDFAGLLLADTLDTSVPDNSALAPGVTTQPAPTSRPLSITLLGTGTPAPSLERQSSGYLIEI